MQDKIKNILYKSAMTLWRTPKLLDRLKNEYKV
jgi:hypothetical protein